MTLKNSYLPGTTGSDCEGEEVGTDVVLVLIG
jgi:hypothetical protein